MRLCWGKVPISNMALKKRHKKRWNGDKQHKDALNTNSWQEHGLLLNTWNDRNSKFWQGKYSTPPTPIASKKGLLSGRFEHSGGVLVQLELNLKNTSHRWLWILHGSTWLGILNGYFFLCWPVSLTLITLYL